MIEAVIALPTLLVALAGVHYMYALYSTQHSVLQQARTQAWANGYGGCHEHDLDAIEAHLGSTDAKAISDYVDQRVHPEPKSVVQNLIDLPVIGPVVNLIFPAGTLGKASKEVKPPPIIGSESQTLTGYMFVPCNEVPFDALQTAINLFQHMVKKWLDICVPLMAADCGG